MMVTSSIQGIPKLKSTSIETTQNSSFNNKSLERTRNHRKQLEYEINVNDVFQENQPHIEPLPILPPIILLDFIDKGNKSLFSDPIDEKSKRTINENLGYGFNQNNILNGKHNFYFPIGKTGTAVSIEESISPFEPKTLTEIIKPITEQSDTNNTHSDYKNHQQLIEALPNPLPLQISREPLPVYPPYPSFGQRTKLQKTSSDFGQHVRRPPIQQLSSMQSTSSDPDSYNKLVATYASMKPAGYQSSYADFSTSTNINGYARPVTSHYINNYMPDTYSSSSNKKSTTNQRVTQINNSDKKQEYNLSNYPRYTIENGIKYEHKIIWKYPDGKISETPPMSYVNSYSEYVEQQKSSDANMDNMQLSNLYQFHPITSKHQQNTQRTSYPSHSSNIQNNIYSQKPVQFPIDQEQSVGDYRKEQSKFYSSVSSDPSPKNPFQSLHSYNPDNYQGQYGLRHNPKYDSNKLTINHKNQDNTYNNHRPIQKYIVNTPDPEFNYQIEDGQENFFLPNGQINKQVLSKYSPEAQNYLMKVFSSGKTKIKNEDQINESENYANTDYSNLLSYNPSITQYIKNPSSILNAQPTFVHVGNSLIPVIILRVDGALPIQSKPGANINLKALLRQYLTQYATSISKATPNTNYNLEGSTDDGEVSGSQQNPVEDLKHLTESLASLRQHGYQDPDFTRNNVPYRQKTHPTYQDNNRVMQDYTTNYSRFVKDYQKIHAGQQMRKPQQKVKSVQIIEDPRYT